MNLSGKVYGFAPPMSSPDEAYTRYSSPPLEIVNSSTGSRLIIKNDSSERRGLDHFAIHARLLRWMKTSAITVEVRRNGVRRWSASFHKSSVSAPQAFEAIVDGLIEFAKHVDFASFSFSVDEISKAVPTLHDFAQLMIPWNLRLEADKDAFGKGQIDAVLYLISCQLAEATLAAIIQRPTIGDKPLDEMRQLTLGQPTVVDAFLLGPEVVEPTAFLLSELAHFAKDIADDQQVLVIDDIIDRIARSRSTQTE